MKVSIIVPVYKVENEIHRCIDSLISQSLLQIEVILIDDGSPDNCPEICDNYAKMHSQIRVIHQKNSGLSSARNTGIINAIGEYLLFVDSDDFIEINTCDNLYNVAVKEDLDILSGMAIRKEIGKIDSLMNDIKFTNNVITGSKFLEIGLSQKKLNMAVWMNLYKRSYILENNLFFKEYIYHEDEEWTPRVFLSANRVTHLKYPFYNYMIREGSITKNIIKRKNAIDLLSTCYSLEHIYVEISNIKLKKLLMNYIAELFMHAIIIGQFTDKKSSKEFNSVFLLNKASRFKTKLKVTVFLINRRFYAFIYDLYTMYK